MTELETLLSEFEKLLKRIKAPVLDKLDEGIDISMSKYKLAQLPSDVMKLYAWRNGVKAQPGNTIGNVSLFPTGILLSIKKCMEIQEKFGGGDSGYGWEKSKFPLFESGGGEFLLIETASSHENYGMLFFHSVGAVDFHLIISKYDSLLMLFRTIFECYKTGIYSYKNGYLTTNDEKEIEISRRYNPLSEYWKLF